MLITYVLICVLSGQMAVPVSQDRVPHERGPPIVQDPLSERGWILVRTLLEHGHDVDNTGRNAAREQGTCFGASSWNPVQPGRLHRGRAAAQLRDGVGDALQVGDERPAAGVQLSPVRMLGDPTNPGHPHTVIEPQVHESGRPDNPAGSLRRQPRNMDRARHQHRGPPRQPRRQDLEGQRVPDLKDRLIERICDITGENRWQVFMNLDDVLDRLAQGADARLAFQNQYPVAANR